ncbi:hypothetical protein R3W88_004989 [Solanum pinnatisectum]|uniref:DUF4283 domain-containing protein n=1 Tax=Solanum pinnatisectum TaxID=50273 RepID=A0AAV9KAW5_9SOLN|nr:hypothetical protein R3W88_004989 [Solanum pinnatisectum]
MDKAIHGGLWFILGSFLSVKCWDSNFAPKESTITDFAIWVRLPQLPTEFYDKSILEKIGKKLGALLKIDACTSATLKERYARICIEVSTGIPVKTSVMIGNHKQEVLYEGEGTLCIGCGRIGHAIAKCTTTKCPRIKQRPKVRTLLAHQRWRF